MATVVVDVVAGTRYAARRSAGPKPYGTASADRVVVVVRVGLGCIARHHLRPGSRGHSGTLVALAGAAVAVAAEAPVPAMATGAASVLRSVIATDAIAVVRRIEDLLLQAGTFHKIDRHAAA